MNGLCDKFIKLETNVLKVFHHYGVCYFHFMIAIFWAEKSNTSYEILFFFVKKIPYSSKVACDAIMASSLSVVSYSPRIKFSHMLPLKENQTYDKYFATVKLHKKIHLCALIIANLLRSFETYLRLISTLYE